MAEPHRLAVYAAPAPDSELGERTAEWFVRGSELTGIDGLTDSARRYGVHATLKPPFRLADGVDAEQVHVEVAMLASSMGPVMISSLGVGAIGRFVALVPAEPCPDLEVLSSECVTRLDHLRRPADPDDVARRRAVGLTARQSELLERWGYPYVLDEFRFHITLSRELDPDQRDRVVAQARRWFGALDGDPFLVGHLCVFEERSPGDDFVERARFPLAAPGGLAPTSRSSHPR